jgi:hypothetical protein
MGMYMVVAALEAACLPAWTSPALWRAGVGKDAKCRAWTGGERVGFVSSSLAPHGGYKQVLFVRMYRGVGAVRCGGTGIL